MQRLDDQTGRSFYDEANSPGFRGTGATGGYTIQALASADLTVRALLRSDDGRASRLRSQGVEIAIGDLLDVDAVAAAMIGVNAAYFVYPIVPELIDASAYFAQAAREAKLGATVNMSQISARRDSLSHQARDHWISERVFDWADILSLTCHQPSSPNDLPIPEYVRRLQKEP